MSIPTSSRRSVLQTYFSFEGRALRREYWLVQLTWFGLLVSCLFLYSSLKASFEVSGRSLGEPMAAVALLLVVVGGVSSLAVNVRRAHDHNHGGALALVTMIPVLGTLLGVALFGVMRGHQGSNRFGPDPRR